MAHLLSRSMLLRSAASDNRSELRRPRLRSR